MKDISSSITTNTDPAYNAFKSGLDKIINNLEFGETIEFNKIDEIINKAIKKESNTISNLEKDYVVPKKNYEMAYSGLVKGLLSTYVGEYVKIDSSKTVEPTNPIALYNDEMYEFGRRQSEELESEWAECFP